MKQLSAKTAKAAPMPDEGVVRRYFHSVTDGSPQAVDDYLRNFPALLENKDSPTGATGIILAAEAGNLDKIKVFHKHKANLNASDNGDQSALFYAGMNGEQEIAAYLVSLGVDPTAKNRSGISPVAIAIASEFPSLGKQMKRQRAEYVERQREEARLKREAELKAMRDNIQQVTEIVGGGLPNAIAAPAKAVFKKNR